MASAALTLATLAPAGAQLAGQLGVLDLTANGGINPSTSAAWAEGDTYRLLFLTSTTTTAMSPDIETYNAFVQATAAASTAFPKLGNGLWKILGSTLAVDARDNTGTNPTVETGVSVFLLDGTSLLAASNAELWSVPSAVPVLIDENGVTQTSGRVFTGSFNDGTGVGAGGGGGSNGDGTGSGDTALGVLDGQGVQTGLPVSTLAGRELEFWIRQWKEPAANALPVYAISEPLTVVDSSDTTKPTLTSIEDDASGGPVAVPQGIVYTVTFDEPMSAGSVDVSDFENDPALSTVVTIDSVTPTGNPAVYEVLVTTTEAGSLRLQIRQNAVLADLPGNELDTSSAIPDDVTIPVGEDLVDPTLVSIDDDVAGAPIVATRSMTPRYTVTFSEPIDPATVAADDFENGSSAPLVIDSVSATGDPAVFEVVVTTSGPGELVLQIREGAEIKDLAGRDLDTTAALPDDTTIIVNPAPDFAGELGVLDPVNANGGINPMTGLAWAEGDTYRLAFVTSTGTTGTSPDITTYNAFVQGVATAAGLGGGTWNVIASTSTVDARDNTGTNPGVDGTGVPVFLMDGTTMFASDNTDLWNGANVPLNIDENGATSANGTIFAGTFVNGTREPIRHLGVTVGDGGGDPPALLVQTGNATRTGAAWIRVWNAPPGDPQSVYALSEPLTIVSAAAGPQITSITAVGGGSWELELLGDPNTGYEFRSSPILDFNPGALVENLTQGDPGDPGTIGGTNDSVLTTDGDGNGTVRMALSGFPSDFVRAQIPPPQTVFTESFDTTLAGSLPAGWDSGKNPADNSSITNWELGTPASVGPIPPGVPLPSADHCIATDIDGNYDDPVSDLGVAHTDIWLRTPAIDLSGASAGTLTFQQWTEIEQVPGDLDYGSIRILDASDDSELATIENQTIDGNTTGWEEYSMELPAAAFTAAAGTIKVEFRFEGDDIDSFAGWYLDDVAVTVP